MGAWRDLIGTVNTVLKIGLNKASLDASALTAARTFTLPDIAGTLALTSQLGGLIKGTAVIDFGAAGSDTAFVLVSNTSVTAASFMLMDLDPAGNAENDADEHQAEKARPRVRNVIPGASFEIYMDSTDQFNLHGKWTVDWVIT